MKPTHLFIILSFVAIDFILIFSMLIGNNPFLVLDPKGMIAHHQRELIMTLIWLMLVVVIPVFIMVFYVGVKYSASNTKTHYTPDWDHDHKLQAFWWAFPLAIVVIMSIINWNTAHKLDPFKPIDSQTKPITIQVVALQWKWLFIYPEQRIATVNMVVFPEKTPLNFELTADAPLNSFWIPQLGGQIYAMPGMSNKLHLIADAPGDYPGSTAELSGPGFAGMRFLAHSVKQSDFDTWVASAKKSPQTLDLATYNALAEPSENTPPTVYASTEEDLYTTIIMKFMHPSHEMENSKFEARNSKQYQNTNSQNSTNSFGHLNFEH